MHPKLSFWTDQGDSEVSDGQWRCQNCHTGKSLDPIAHSELLLHTKFFGTHYRLPPLEGTGASTHLTSGNNEANGVFNRNSPQISAMNLPLNKIFCLIHTNSHQLMLVNLKDFQWCLNCHWPALKAPNSMILSLQELSLRCLKVVMIMVILKS